MKKLFVLPLLMLLTGCVTYYYPETAMEDGVYYAEDDPSYAVYSGGYSAVDYYPWYSVDYFYLGYYPAPAYRVGYAYPGGFSIGFSYGFAPWYYPYHYYGYYSPWYGSHHHHHYAHHPAWRPYRGYYSNHKGDRHGKKKKRHYDDPYDGYARDDRDGRRLDDDDLARKRGGGQALPNSGGSSVRRYVSAAPGGSGGDRGMVIRNRDSAKVGDSRLDVDKGASKGAVRTGSVDTRAVAPDYNVKRTAGEVRYRSNAKQGKSRTGPVNSSATSNGIAISATPSTTVNDKASRTNYSTKRGGNEVRYRSDAKQGKARTGPVNASGSSKGPSIKAAPASANRATPSRSNRQTAPARKQATVRSSSSNRAKAPKSRPAKSSRSTSRSSTPSSKREVSQRKNRR